MQERQNSIYDIVTLAHDTKQNIENNKDSLMPYEPVIAVDTNELMFKDEQGNIVTTKVSVNTIGDLKTFDAPIGTMVFVKGFYSVGDGAHHYRQKVDSTYTGVDAIEGWKIVHNGEVNISWFGAKGDGVFDDTQSLKNALDFCDNVLVNSDKLCLNESIILKQNSQLNLNSHIIYKGLGNVFELKLGSVLNGNNSLIEIQNPSWDSTVIYLSGINRFYHEGTKFKDLRMKNSVRKGTAVFFDCSSESAFITFVKSENIYADGFNFGLTLSCARSGTTESQWSWINSNVFKDYDLRLCNTAIYMNGTPGVPAEMANNEMLGFKLEVDTTSTLAGHQNIFELFIWDWDYSRPNKPIAFYPGSLNNELTTNISYEGIEGVDNNNCFIYHRNGVNYDTSDRIFSRKKTFRKGLQTNLIEPNDGGQLEIKQTSNGSGNVNILDGLFVNGSIKPWTTNYLDIGTSEYRFNKIYVNQIVNQNQLVQLDTPYHATRMSKLGILDSYHNYLTELHEYDKSQNTQSDTGVMNLNVIQPPVIPTEVEEYAKEYNLI